MATTIVTKSGSGAPTASDLVAGELAVDLTNKRLYTEDSGGTVLELGTNPSGDVTFADNGKAIFGAGSDLSIYSDGSISRLDSTSASLAIKAPQFIVQDAGGTKNMVWVPQNGGAYEVQLSHDGSTKLTTTATGIDVTGTVVADGIESSGDFAFTAADGMQIIAKETVGINIDSDDNDSSRAFTVTSGSSGSSETLILASEDAGVTLYHDNAAKIATTATGIDITGTATMDGLVVDTGSTFALSGTFGHTGGSQLFFLSDDGGARNQIDSQTNGSSAKLDLATGGTKRQRIDSNGDISFYEDTGTTPKFHWSASAESLGIGTSSPNAKLSILGTSGTYPTAFIGHSLVDTSGEALRIGRSDNQTIRYHSINAIQSQTSGDNTLSFNLHNASTSTSQTEVMTLKGSGNVGIGTDSPSYKLETKDGDIATVKLTAAAGGNAVNGLRFRVNNSSNTAESATLGMINAETVNSWGGVLTFSTKAANGTPNETVTERMRIGSDGVTTFKYNTKVYTAGYPETRLGITDSNYFNFTFDNPSDALSIGKNGSTKITLTASGNVGIGTTSPSYNALLDVNGIIRANVGSGGLSLSGYSSPDMGYFSYNYTNSNGTEVVPQSIRSSHRLSMGNGAQNAITFDYRAPYAAAGTWSERMRIDSDGVAHFNGDVKVLSGDIQMGSGRGINFSASSNAGGMSSETLDDYEEGTFTPVLAAHSGTSPTISGTNSGSYTKVGRLVSVIIELNVTSISGVTSNYITCSLPISAAVGAGYYSQGSQTNSSVAWARPENVGPTLYSADKLGFLSSDNAGGGWGWEEFGAFSGNEIIRLSFSYFAT